MAYRDVGMIDIQVSEGITHTANCILYAPVWCSAQMTTSSVLTSTWVVIHVIVGSCISTCFMAVGEDIFDLII